MPFLAAWGINMLNGKTAVVTGAAKVNVEDTSTLEKALDKLNASA